MAFARVPLAGSTDPDGYRTQAVVADKTTRRIYLASITDEALTVWRVDPQDGSVQEQRVDVTGLTLKPGRRLAELEVVGLGHEDQTLYAMTGPYNLLLAIDTERWTIENVVALESLSDSQGISVRDGRVYVVTDHEYHEPLPPLRWAELP